MVCVNFKPKLGANFLINGCVETLHYDDPIEVETLYQTLVTLGRSDPNGSQTLQHLSLAGHRSVQASKVREGLKT